MLSRFDLIFIMVDNHDVTEEMIKTDFRLSRHCVDNSAFKQREKAMWSSSKLKHYINFV